MKDTFLKRESTVAMSTILNLVNKIEELEKENEELSLNMIKKSRVTVYIEKYIKLDPKPKKVNLDESKNNDQNDPIIDFHLNRIKLIQDEIENKRGNLMARVFLRATGAVNNQKGYYIISSEDLFAWFNNADYLRSHTEYDTM